MRIRLMTCAAVLAAGFTLAGCATGSGPAGGSPDDSGFGGPSGPGGPGRHAVMLSDDGRPGAELDVTSGVTAITIGTGARGGPLVRASTPAGSSIRPVVSGGRVIQVTVASTGLRGPADLRIALDPSVRWRLVLSGGASSLRLNLGSARLRGLRLTAGFDVIAMRLPAPSGQVTAVLAGGASAVRVSLPAGIPARLVLAGGAGSATLPGRSYSGLAGGTVLTTAGWAGTASRYRIDATAGLASVHVTKR